MNDLTEEITGGARRRAYDTVCALFHREGSGGWEAWEREYAAQHILLYEVTAKDLGMGEFSPSLYRFISSRLIRTLQLLFPRKDAHYDLREETQDDPEDAFHDRWRDGSGTKVTLPSQAVAGAQSTTEDETDSVLLLTMCSLLPEPHNWVLTDFAEGGIALVVQRHEVSERTARKKVEAASKIMRKQLSV
jgi:hypothetical protein